MKINSRHVGIGLVVLFLLCIGLFFGAQWYSRQKVEELLSREMPPEVSLEYNSLEWAFLSGTLDLNKVQIAVKTPSEQQPTATIQIEKLSLKRLEYWTYLKNDSLRWKEVILQAPYIQHTSTSKKKAGAAQRKSNRSLRPWKIEKLLVTRGGFSSTKPDSSKSWLKAGNINLLLTNVRATADTARGPIPIDYDQFTLNLKELYTEVGAFELLTADSLSMDSNVLKAWNMGLNTKFSREELSERIEQERDHFTFKIPEVSIYDIRMVFRDSLGSLEADSIALAQPSLEMYRDKLEPDNPGESTMYSRKLREVPFRLTVPKIIVRQGSISYEERIESGLEPGHISFDSINAELLHISNTYSEPVKTEIKATAIFMEQADMEFNWSFDVNNEEEFFTASGSFSNFTASKVNAFMEASMNARIQGYLNILYFTLGGNQYTAAGEIKMKYKNFDFNILKEDGKEVNKLLSTIGSLFIKENKNKDSPDFRFGTIEAEREPSKSFFNYLWRGLRSGIKNTLTGDGKKDDD